MAIQIAQIDFRQFVVVFLGKGKRRWATYVVRRDSSKGLPWGDPFDYLYIWDGNLCFAGSVWLGLLCRMSVEKVVGGEYLIEGGSIVHKFKWSIEIKFRFIIFHEIVISKYYKCCGVEANSISMYFYKSSYNWWILISCDSFEFDGVFERLADKVLGIEVHLAVSFFLEVDLFLFYCPDHVVLLQGFVVFLSEVSQFIHGIELEDSQGFFEWYFWVGLFCAFGYFCPDGFWDGIQEGTKIISQGVLLS